MIPYLLHASILLSGCFIFYWLFIRKETFFKLNRWVLISGIVLSIIIPLILIPESWSLKKGQQELSSIEKISKPIEIETSPANDLSSKKTDQAMETNTSANIQDDNTAIENIETSFFENVSQFSSILWYIYLAGVVIFFAAFLIQLIILLTKMYSYISFKDGSYRIVELVKDEAPYSFWNSIFINPTKYDIETYTQIINHEKIHIRQAHFIDKILAELLLIAFWFNPFVWLYRNAITNNLEYLTDSSMLKEGVEKQTYQLSLLKVSVPQHPLNLSTNYNNSFLKNRIAMMNSKKSSARSSWKYLFLLPLIGFSMISMNETQSNKVDLLSTNENSELLEQDSLIEPINSTVTSITSEPVEVITKVSTFDSENEEEGAVETETTRVITTEKSITIEGTNEMVMEGFTSSDWNTDLRPGQWDGEIDGNRVCFQLNNSRPAKGWTSISTECFDRSELSEIPRGADKDFFIKRAAGTLNMNGSFTDEFGDGTFKFEGDATFLSYLKSEGMDVSREHDQYHLFLNNVNKEYVNELKSQGFKPKGRDLVNLSVHGIDRTELKDFMSIFKDLDYKEYNVQDLVQFKIHDVNPAYVNEIRALGMTDLSINQVVQAKIHDVEPSYIKAVQDYGFKGLKIQDIIQFSIHDVDVEYIEELKKIGYKDLSFNEIVQFSIHDIEPSYIHEFEKAGLSNLSSNEIIQAGIHDVDAEFVKELKAYGMQNLQMNQIVQMAIHDVDVDYMKEMKALGYSDLSANDIVQAKIHDVDPDYIKELKENGLDQMEMNEIVQFAIHDIDVQHIKAYKAAGFKLDTGEIIQAGIHDISPKYIERMRGLGFTETDMGDFIQAKIHGVNPSFIKRAREKGHNPETLREYVKLKISGI